MQKDARVHSSTCIAVSQCLTASPYGQRIPTLDSAEREMQTVQMSVSHTHSQPVHVALEETQSNCTLALWGQHIALSWLCSDS